MIVAHRHLLIRLSTHASTYRLPNTSSLPANERTFLGYLRTSLALSMLGITVAQLYRLQHSAVPDAKLGYFILSKPIAGLFQCSAITVVIVGSVRFYRQQHAMSVGKVHVGGWEILTIMGLVFLVSLFF